jgi:hypothetical protein
MKGMTMVKQEAGSAAKPTYVEGLEAAFGPPSQEAWGSAAFHRPLSKDRSIDEAALGIYKHFVGALWARYGEDAWMGPWRAVFTRAKEAEPDIVAELAAIDDPDAKRAVPLVLELSENADERGAALVAAFDAPSVTELKIYNIGDGEAMSGVLVAGRRAGAGEAAFVACLMD